MQAITLARAQGAFNLANGLWPLLHMRSFEAVLGPKRDRWLVRTVAGLLCVNGLTQLLARRHRASISQARATGVGTAATLAAIDLIYAPPGRIRRIYLVDAVAEIVWIALWSRHSGERESVKEEPEFPGLRCMDQAEADVVTASSSR